MTLVNQVRTIIDEPSTAKFWPLPQVYDAINEASIEVLGTAQLELATATITATASARYVALPTTLMVPKFILTPAQMMLPKTNYAVLQRDNVAWRERTGDEHLAFVEFDVNTIELYPYVGTAVVYRVVGVPYPAEVTALVEDFSSSPVVNDPAKFFAGSVLFDATRPDLSDVMRAEGEEHMRVLMRTKRNNQNHRLHTLRPASPTDARRTGELNQIRGFRYA